MKNFKQSFKKNKNKKGFTLVEIIVVLVILAVLAAAAIPTMLGFVEDAKGKAEIANARAAYVAAQSIVTEEYASGAETIPTGGTAKYLTTGVKYTIAKDQTTKLNKMLGADMVGAEVTPTIDAGKVTVLLFNNNNYTVTITSGKDTTVVKNP